MVTQFSPITKSMMFNGLQPSDLLFLHLFYIRSTFCLLYLLFYSPFILFLLIIQTCVFLMQCFEEVIWLRNTSALGVYFHQTVVSDLNHLSLFLCPCVFIFSSKVWFSVNYCLCKIVVFRLSNILKQEAKIMTNVCQCRLAAAASASYSSKCYSVEISTLKNCLYLV